MAKEAIQWQIHSKEHCSDSTTRIRVDGRAAARECAVLQDWLGLIEMARCRALLRRLSQGYVRLIPDSNHVEVGASRGVVACSW